MPLLNPFSNRTSMTSSDYIQKKKNITKIAYLKKMPWKNFKTSTYVVCDNRKALKYEYKAPLPSYYPEPPFPFELPHIEANLYYHDEMKDYGNQPSTHQYNNNVAIGCEKCGYAIKKMEISPNEWVCDNWKPPYTSCERGNGAKQNHTVVAYCCQNVSNCNYIICDKCYTIKYVNKKNHVKKLEMKDDVEIDVESIDYKKEVPPPDFTKFPIVKMARSHQELLDLTKGFYLTEPDCENRYPNSCQLKGEKRVNNICEGKYSVLDLGNKCLYDDFNEEYKFSVEKTDKDIEGKEIRVDSVIIENKLRTNKGLINLVGTIHQKQGQEAIFQYPIPLHKTTTFVQKENNHHPPVQIHNIPATRFHKHVFPDNNVMVSYTHKHSTKPHKPKSGKSGNRPPHPTNNLFQFNSYTPSISLTKKNKPAPRYSNFRLF